MIKIGAHMQISGGIENVPENTLNIGANSFQVFVHSPRTWSVKEPDKESVEKFIKNVSGLNFKKENMLVHSGYLINLASPKEESWEKSFTLFSEEIKIACMYGIKYYNFHPGSHLGEGKEYGSDKIARSIDLFFKDNEDKDIFLLLENVASKGNTIGGTMSELGEIIKKSSFGDRVGITYDTCHGFDSGYDIRDREDTERLLSEIDKYIGIDKLKMIHLNDSKFDLSAGKDRHEFIGKGFIGDSGFRNFLSFDKFLNTTMILETPGDDDAHSEDIRHIKEDILKC